MNTSQALKPQRTHTLWVGWLHEGLVSISLTKPEILQKAIPRFFMGGIPSQSISYGLYCGTHR
jgi:hypothetical protein